MTHHRSLCWIEHSNHGAEHSLSFHASMYYTLQDCDKHNGVDGADLWVVVESFVLDLTAFLEHHPAGARKILQKRSELGPDITPNFVDHFGHTVRAFREACRKYENQQNEKSPVALLFRETPGIEVVVIGKLRR